jgi:FixJ family two-component response regulator
VNDQDRRIVYILDDEAGMVKALTRLLFAEGFNVQGFTSPAIFLRAYRPELKSCLVLDVAMPEIDGLEFQKHLRQMGIVVPIIFLTGHGDVAMSLRAVKAGAVDFLSKPVNDEELLRAVRTALDHNCGDRSGSQGGA